MRIHEIEAWRSRRSSQRTRPDRRRRRPRLEELERLRLLSNTFPVSLSTDDGTGNTAGTLSYAITMVNEDSTDTAADPDQITFDVAGGGQKYISIYESMPSVTNPVIIDGTTQPGFDPFEPTPMIDLNDVNEYGGGPGLILNPGSAGSTIRGLDISNSSGRFEPALLLNSGPNTGDDLIAGNYLGIDLSGQHRSGNYSNGIHVYSSQNTIGGTTAADRNVVSGNGDAGIVLDGSGASSNLVEGNYVGVDATGLSAVPNYGEGIDISDAADNTIGGSAAGAGNVISGNDFYGIDLYDESTSGTVIEGNIIGLDKDGVNAIPNANQGISDDDSGDVQILDNVISANDEWGIFVYGDTAQNLLIQGNLIGVAADGSTPQPNHDSGIQVSASNNTIGGTTAGAGNVISGNGGDGITFSGSGATDNLVEGNDIGTDSSGTLDIPNGGNGISIVDEASNNSIGGTVTGTGNVIAFNSNTGVVVGYYSADPSTGNAILGNSIFANANLGIDLGTDGVTLNDSSGHDGPNLFQDFPVLTGATNSPSGATITGTVQGPADSTLQVQLFSNSSAAPSGYGQGQTLLGTVAVNTDDSGAGSFTFVTASSLEASPFISATATDAAGDTSEFSQDISISTTFLVTQNSDDGLGDVPNTLSWAIDQVNSDSLDTQASPDQIAFDVVSSGQQSISVTGSLPHIANPVILDATTQPGYDPAAPGPMIELDGTNAGTGNGLTLDSGSAGSTIRGLDIANFQGAGLVLNGGSNTGDDLVAGNSIGLDLTGTGLAGNNGDGLDIDSAGNTVGGTTAADRDVISGNQGIGVLMNGSNVTDNVVEGDYIGTDSTGLNGLGNQGEGVVVFSGMDNTIGGSSAGAGNIISGNGFAGIFFAYDGTSYNLVQGNIVGLDKNGALPVPNGADGMELDDGQYNQILDNVFSGNGITGFTLYSNTGTAAPQYNLVQGNILGLASDGTTPEPNADNGMSIYTSNNTIGGPTAADANVISGNAENGLRLLGDDNVAEGNEIGITAAGLVGIPNGNDGVILEDGATDNIIGGTPNIISDNGGAGVEITDSGTTGNQVLANFIGTGPDGFLALGNTGAGVLVHAGASSNTIGGSSPADGNLIAFNGANGVVVGDNTTDDVSGDAILSNSIDSNTGLGIDLADDGVTLNDSSGHTGPNLFQDFPVLTSVLTGSWGTGITGTVQGPANSTLQVQFFANAVADPTGYGQGQTLLGTVAVNTGTDGGGSFSFVTPISSEGFAYVSATATDAAGNTSEFSQDFTATTGFVVTQSSDDGLGDVPNTLSWAIDQVNSDSLDTQASPDQIAFDVAGGGQQSISVTGILPHITNPVIIDATTQPGFNPAAPTPMIELDGTNAGSGDGLVLDPGSAGSTIRGLDIANSQGPGLVLNSGSNTGGDLIAGNYIGLDLSGTVSAGNNGDGLDVYSGGNTVGGTTAADRDVISGNQGTGLVLGGYAASDNLVEGNYIGTDQTGETGLANHSQGMDIFNAPYNTIGGSASGAGNVISGNDSDGIFLYYGGTPGNIIQGNIIGLDKDGANPIPNGGEGVEDGYTNDLQILDNIISSNGNIGIVVYGNTAQDLLIQANLIGVAADGITARPNTNDGILMFSSNNTIGGTTAAEQNVISGNGAYGIQLSGPTDDLIEGNYVGTDSTGTQRVPNGQEGILVNQGASSNTIGGTNAGERNVISGNDGAGIVLDGSTGIVTDNVIEGNYIGTDWTGLNGLGNKDAGINVFYGASNTIGGSAAGAGNIISGNGGDGYGGAGIYVEYVQSSYNLVQGNIVGLDKNGALPIPNLYDGMELDDGQYNQILDNVFSANGITGFTLYSNTGTAAPQYNLVQGNILGLASDGTTPEPNADNGMSIYTSNNTIGGPTVADANVISGNAENGLRLLGNDNIAEGNDIGTDASGTLPRPNGDDGVIVFDGASNNTIGGSSPADGNIIAFNGAVGVVIGDSTTDDVSGDAILSNSIFGNTGLGIDLADDGVTLNNSSGHTGPNLFQDFPVLTSVVTGSSATTITGTVQGPANSTLQVQLFSSASADPSGHGQGQTLLGTISVPTNGSGDGSFSLTTTSPLAQGLAVSATATDAAGNSSEFSRDLLAVTNVSGQISYTRSGIVFNRFTGIYTGTITLKNIGSTTITGPIQIVLTGLTPGVTLIDASGTTPDGDPYITYSGNLGAGKSVTVTLQFRKTSPSLYINYTPQFYTGSFTPSLSPDVKLGSKRVEKSSNHPAGPLARFNRTLVAQLGSRLSHGRLGDLQREY